MAKKREAFRNFWVNHPFFKFLCVPIVENIIWLAATNIWDIPFMLYFFVTVPSQESIDDWSSLAQNSSLNFSLRLRFLVIFVIVLITFIIMILLHAHKCRKNAEDKANNLEQQFSETSLVSEKISELEGQLAAYKEKEQLVSVLADYTNKSDLVDSIQLYTHPTLPNPKDIDANSVTDISFQFLNGTASADTNVNALYHIRYQLGYDIYYPLHKLFLERNAYYSEHKRRSNPEQERAIQADAISLFKTISDKLNNLKHISEINDIHYAYYRILEILATLVIANEELVECKKLLAYSDGVESQLKTGQRTGLLGTLFINSMYYFGNENSTSKKNRCYFTAPLDYKGNKMIMLVVLQKDKLRLAPQHEELECCKEIYDEINRLLVDTLSERRSA